MMARHFLLVLVDLTAIGAAAFAAVALAHAL